MGFQANVLNVMIASPGDVTTEREIVTEELLRWNAANGLARRLLLQPVKWETHSSPQMGSHPQSIINERLLTDADIVVGIFGIRIGSATREYISGSVEEIKRHVANGKLAMLYFSRVPIDPTTIDQDQWTALQAFKEECKSGGLYAEYGSHEQLKSDFGHHLTVELNRPKYIWLEIPKVGVALLEPDLSEQEAQLLIATASDRNGQIIATSTMDGFYVQTNNQNFVEDSPRSAAQWKHVLKRLLELAYVDQVSNEVYELTEEGFARADKEAEKQVLEISLSFTGRPDNQVLVVKATRTVTLKQLDFLTSSEAQISSTELENLNGSEITIPIDSKKVVELFNAPRPDRNYSDHSGPAKLRLVFVSGGQLRAVILPILLEPRFVQNTQWIQLKGSNTFEIG